MHEWAMQLSFTSTTLSCILCVKTIIHFVAYLLTEQQWGCCKAIQIYFSGHLIAAD